MIVGGYVHVFLKDGKIIHRTDEKGDVECGVILLLDEIKIGCTSITIEAAKFLLHEQKKLKTHRVILQPYKQDKE